MAGHFKPWEVAHMKGMARLGLNELRAMFYADSNVRETDAGIFGRATQVEISAQRNPDMYGPHEEQEQTNLLAAKQKELQDRQVKQEKQPEKQMDSGMSK
jgi:hypothetical protein